MTIADLSAFNIYDVDIIDRTHASRMRICVCTRMYVCVDVLYQMTRINYAREYRNEKEGEKNARSIRERENSSTRLSNIH